MTRLKKIRKFFKLKIPLYHCSPELNGSNCATGFCIEAKYWINYKEIIYGVDCLYNTNERNPELTNLRLK